MAHCKLFARMVVLESGLPKRPCRRGAAQQVSHLPDARRKTGVLLK